MGSADRMTWEQAVLWLKSQQDRQELVRACYYDDPLADAARRFHVSSEWLAVQRLLQGQTGRALEIGAGRGIASYALARDGWQVSALEPDPSDEVGAGAIRRLCRETETPIEITTEWGERLPYGDGSFDLVYCRAVLHHARDLRSLCVEAGRVLCSGGILLATREHVISNRADIEAFHQMHALHWLYGGENAFLLDEYVAAIRAAGFSISKVLNPLASDINVFPETLERLRTRWTRKLHLPFALRLPTVVLRLVGASSRSPGRLYSFLAVKS